MNANIPIPKLTINPITQINGNPVSDPFDRGYITGVLVGAEMKRLTRAGWTLVGAVSGSVFTGGLIALLQWLANAAR
jgi:hypothetical protein